MLNELSKVEILGVKDLVCEKRTILVLGVKLVLEALDNLAHHVASHPSN